MEETRSLIDAVMPGGPLAPLFPDLTTWAPWTVPWKVLYGDALDENELAVFQTFTGRERPREGGYPEGWFVIGRRGGKSRTAATIALFEAMLKDWPARMAPGETGWIHVLAPTKDQAKIVMSYIVAGLELFPKAIKTKTSEAVYLKNGLAIGVRAASLRNVRGYTTVCLVCDEMAWWRDAETSANPAQEVLTAVMPGLKPDGKLISISSTYGQFGVFYDTWKNYWAADSEVLVWRAPARVMNPTLTDAAIDRLIRRFNFAREEFEAEWRLDVSNFLSESLVNMVCVRPQTLAQPQFKYMAFVDPSGGSHDDMSLAIGHREADKVILDRAELRHPPFDPAKVVEEFGAVLASYGLRQCTSDRYGGIWTQDAFRKVGVQITYSDRSTSEIYSEFQPLVTMGKVELIDDAVLKGQLTGLERRTQSGGKDKIDAPPGGKDDLSNAVAGCMVLLAQDAPWSEAEQEAWSKVPIKSEHKADPILSPSLKSARRQAEIAQECEEIMDEDMKAFGGSKIIRR